MGIFLLGWVIAAAKVGAADIADCGDIRSFRVAPYLALAVELQALPEKDAVARLQSWADSGKHDEPVILLCRMLFQARTGGEFRRPMLGGPGFFGGTKLKDWPLEPITIVDDVPFLIVSSYMLAGHAEEAPSYLKYCLTDTDWTTRRYRALGRTEIASAFDKLLKATPWKLTDWDRKMLGRQIE